MKKITKRGWAALLMAGCLVMSLTSCLDSNDDQPQLTREDIQQAYLMVAGTHTGKLVYPAQNPKVSADRADSLDISWNIISDSIMIIKNFPVKAVAENVQGTDLKNLLLTAPDQDLKCYIGFYSRTPVAFLVNPSRLTYNLTKDGQNKKVEVVFYNNISGSLGVLDKTKGGVGVQMVEAAILVDGQEREVFRQGIFMYMAEDKKI